MAKLIIVLWLIGAVYIVVTQAPRQNQNLGHKALLKYHPSLKQKGE